MEYAYPLWLGVFVFLPSIIIHFWKPHLHRKYAYVYILAPVGSLIFSIPWDVISVKERIWYFTTPHIFGVWLFGLPIEEYLFIIFVTILFVDVTLLLYERYGVRT